MTLFVRFVILFIKKLRQNFGKKLKEMVANSIGPTAANISK
jgi:hypothetical protein